MNHDTIKYPALKQHHQDNTNIHTKGVCQIFDIPYANILKMVLDNSTYGLKCTIDPNNQHAGNCLT